MQGQKDRKQDRWKQMLNRSFWEDTLSVVFGILLCVAIGLVLYRPTNRVALMLLFVAGGGVNLFNGMKLYRNKKQRNMGMSMILLGAVILVIGMGTLFGGAW